MYQPPHFVEDRLAVQHALIREHSLGLLFTAGPAGLQANYVPFFIDAEVSERGTLRAHLARANPQIRELAAVTECLIVFQDRSTTSVRRSIRQSVRPKRSCLRGITSQCTPGAPACHRRFGLVAPPDRGTDGAQGETLTVPWKVSDAPELTSRRRSKALSASKSRSAVLKANGRSARTGLRSIRPVLSRVCVAVGRGRHHGGPGRGTQQACAAAAETVSSPSPALRPLRTWPEIPPAHPARDR